MTIGDLIEEGRSAMYARGASLDVVNALFTDDVEFYIQQQILERVSIAMHEAMIGAQAMLDTTAAEYISGLTVDFDGYGPPTISIDSSVEYLENGYGPFDMLPGLVNSKNSKIAADGSRYAVIPVGAKKTAQEDSMARLNFEQQTRGIALDGTQSLNDAINSMHNTLTNQQPTPAGEKPDFRVASTKQTGSGKWQHPGFAGVQQLASINERLAADTREIVRSFVEDVYAGW